VNCNQELRIELLSVIKFHRETEPTLIRYNILTWLYTKYTNAETCDYAAKTLYTYYATQGTPRHGVRDFALALCKLSAHRTGVIKLCSAEQCR
jgi:hypothetical protein